MKNYSEEEYKKFYNGKYLIHEQSVKDSFEINRRLLSFKDCINEHKDINNILDAGCSKGYLNKINTDKKLFGIDISKKLLDDIQGYTEVKEGSLLKIPYKTNQFDLVVCFQVLEHIEDYQKAIKELIRVSNKYILLSTDFVTKSDRIFSRDPLKNPHGHMHQFNINKFMNLLMKENLKIEKIEYHFPLFKYSTTLKSKNIIKKIIRIIIKKINAIIEIILFRLYFKISKIVLEKNKFRLLLNYLEKLFKIYGKIIDLEVEICFTLKK